MIFTSFSGRLHATQCYHFSGGQCIEQQFQLAFPLNQWRQNPVRSTKTTTWSSLTNNFLRRAGNSTCRLSTKWDSKSNRGERAVSMKWCNIRGYWGRLCSELISSTLLKLTRYVSCGQLTRRMLRFEKKIVERNWWQSSILTTKPL